MKVLDPKLGSGLWAGDGAIVQQESQGHIGSGGANDMAEPNFGGASAASRSGGMFAFVAVVCACLLLHAASASAQTAGSIAGVVRDTSGAVVPGVTVEVASPALIE